MRERDREAAVYRDAVLECGVVIRLRPEEAVLLCRRVARLAKDSRTRAALELGVFVTDDMTRILLALPPQKDVINDVVNRFMGTEGLRLAAERIRRRAAKERVR